MENTLENQNAFFAKYFGQKCFYPYGDDVEHFVDTPTIENHIPNVSYLHLKPISLITAKEAVDVALILDFNIRGFSMSRQEDRVIFYNKHNNETTRIDSIHVLHHIEIYGIDESGKIYNYGWDVLIKVTDFLRSKGFYVDFGAELEYGWAELKTE